MAGLINMIIGGAAQGMVSGGQGQGKPGDEAAIQNQQMMQQQQQGLQQNIQDQGQRNQGQIMNFLSLLQGPNQPGVTDIGDITDFVNRARGTGFGAAFRSLFQ